MKTAQACILLRQAPVQLCNLEKTDQFSINSPLQAVMLQKWQNRSGDVMFWRVSFDFVSSDSYISAHKAKNWIDGCLVLQA